MTPIKPKVYVVAVSGGVDSVALLNMLINRRLPEENQKLEGALLVVAHVDHGIRLDSGKDVVFVRRLAKENGLVFELKKLNLGLTASEDTARQARYEFLFKLKEKYQASAVVTAHHQDDLIETAIINLLRGTKFAGLASMNRAGIWRPLLKVSKAEIIDYAARYKLTWREDSTNQDDKFLRNQIRHQLMPKLGQKREEFIKIIDDSFQVRPKLDHLADQMLGELFSRPNIIDRRKLNSLSHDISCLIIHRWLINNGLTNLTNKFIGQTVISLKTLENNSKISLAGNKFLHITNKEVAIVEG
jgi:tRNA(Ile)-lysidine synthetase-like protein